MITLVVAPLEVNCYMIWDPETMDAFVIDPGGDADRIEREVLANSLNVNYIVNTHGHFDHVGGDGELARVFGAPVAIHRLDAGLLAEAEERARFFGVKALAQPAPEILLEDGATLSAGSLTLEVIHTPGHTPGGVCLYDRAGGLLFTGDTLFAGSVGRTDLDGGSHEALINSIKTRLLGLGDEVRVLPGHGPETTIGAERAGNPFLSSMEI